MNKKFNLPKFRKQQSVKTPHGQGVVETIDFNRLGYFYVVNNRVYAEIELKPLSATHPA